MEHGTTTAEPRRDLIEPLSKERAIKSVAKRNNFASKLVTKFYLKSAEILMLRRFLEFKSRKRSNE